MIPKYLTPEPNIRQNPRWQWPPSIGVCPLCSRPTFLVGESYGRRVYLCDDTDCPAHKEMQWYGHPTLFSIHVGDSWMVRYSDKHKTRPYETCDKLGSILVLLEDRPLIPVLFKCCKCSVSGLGLWSEEATAGFTWCAGECVCDACNGSSDPTLRDAIRAAIGEGR